MSTIAFYQAVKMLNDKCIDDWQTAFSLMNENERNFVRSAMNGSAEFSKDTFTITITKKEDYFSYQNQIWKISERYPDLLVSNKGNVFEILKIDCETKSNVTIKVKCVDASLTNKGYLLIYRNATVIKLHVLVYDTFKERDNEKIFFRDGNTMNCRLSNLYTTRDKPKERKKRDFPIEKNKLYPFKDEILEMKFGQMMSYESISKKYGVTAPTVSRFIKMLKEKDSNDVAYTSA